ncbi:MAG: YtxH domain-containing protein [Acidobacteriaceae bacterium]|nr:YtxH domain-containing protein [Acidobacteriaceae bacterium]MBV9779318.1 YtxH domain-containing protein [Acidobacteriaceae bacterium]
MPTKAGSSTSEFTDRLSDTAQTVKEKVSDAASTAKQKVSDAGRQASDKIDEKRGPAADALESAASTLHEKAEDLPGGETVKSVAHSAAEKLESTAGYIREHDVRAMLSDVEEIVKRNPGPSLLVAVAIGFLIGRAFRED